MMMISILVIHKVLLNPIFYITLYFNFYCIIVFFICSYILLLKFHLNFLQGSLEGFFQIFLDIVWNFFKKFSLVFFKFVLGFFQAFVSKAHLGLQGFLSGFFKVFYLGLFLAIFWGFLLIFVSRVILRLFLDFLLGFV